MSDLKTSEYDFTKIPYKDLVRVGQRTMLYRDMFTVSWLLGRYCNYRCSYCWPYARSDTKDHRPTPLMLHTVDEIKRQARERGFNSFHFSLSGLNQNPVFIWFKCNFCHIQLALIKFSVKNLLPIIDYRATNSQVTDFSQFFIGWGGKDAIFGGLYDKDFEKMAECQCLPRFQR